MWLLWSCISILLYAFCEIYEKKGSDIEEPYSGAKMLVWFGIFGLAVALFVSLTGLRESRIGFFKMAVENPAMILSTVFYFLSLLLAFISLKLIPVSVEAPITNTSGSLSFIGAILLYAVLGKYREIRCEVTPVKLIVVLVIFAVVALFSLIYHHRVEIGSDDGVPEWNRSSSRRRRRLFSVLGIVFAVLSAASDAGNSVVSYYVLDEVAESNDYLFFSNLLFSLLGAGAWVFVSIKEKRLFNPFEKTQSAKAIGAGLDCAGMVTNVLAINENPFFADAIISTYFVFTVLLSHIMLKEKLNRKQCLCVAILVICICAFAFLDA